MALDFTILERLKAVVDRCIEQEKHGCDARTARNQQVQAETRTQ